MRSHLDEFASLLHTLTQATHVDQSHHVCNLAAKLELTQSVLAEMFSELSQPTAWKIIEGIDTRCCQLCNSVRLHVPVFAHNSGTIFSKFLSSSWATKAWF